MPSAKVTISAYGITNPHLSSDVDVSLVDKNGKFYLTKQDKGYRPKYVLDIPDTTDFDFIYRGEDAETSIQNLITAINLNLKKVAFTRHISDKEYEHIDYTEKEKEEYDIGLFGRMGIIQEADVSKESVIDTFDKIASLDRFNLNTPTVKEMNLIKAVSLYETAIESSNKFIQHMMFYMTMETACLYDGNYLKGAVLDQKMSNLSGIAEKHIRQWRRLYNRQKHVDTDQSDVEKTKNVMENPSGVKDFRSAANQVLHKRL